MSIKKVGMLTGGGLAPCLSSIVGGLIERYTEIAPEVEIVCYRSGYKGLLLGDSIAVTPEIRDKVHLLHRLGGSPIGNSRIKLANVEDCVEHGYVKEGQDPRQVAADQLVKDGVDVLHTIGGDDTSTVAADLAEFLKKNGYDLTVIGLPKTIDNDIIPVRQSLGAWTAAEQGARYFSNVVAEHSANPHMLIVHEVMGRECGWLAATTAQSYREGLTQMAFVPEIDLGRPHFDIHGVFLPEMAIDIPAEAERLKKVMDKLDNVNIFINEGAGAKDIVAEMEARGEKVPRDSSGHVRLNDVKVGEWFGKQFGEMINAEKTLVQKSGYFSRSAPANVEDIRLIKGCVDLAVECAMRGEPGLIGHDEGKGGKLRAIELSRVKGGKKFDIDQPWFESLLSDIGQAKGEKVPDDEE